MNEQKELTAVEWLQQQQKELLNQVKSGEFKIEDFEYYNALYIEQAKEMEKEQKIALLKSLVYSVCIGDDVEDVEEWLKKHELNKSE